MKKLDPTILVDLVQEQKAIADFLAVRWTGFTAWEALVATIAEKAKARCGAWVDRFALQDELFGRMEIRQKRLAKSRPEAADFISSYDVPSKTLLALTLGTGTIAELAQNLWGKWNYEKESDTLLAELHTRFANINLMSPIGFAESLATQADPREVANAASGAQHDAEAFTGYCDQTCRTLPFITRVSLSEVYWDKVNQGRSAVSSLVGAVFAYFITMIEHNNGVLLREAVAELILNDDQPDFVFDVELSSSFPILQAILTHMGTSAYVQENGEQAQQALEKAIAADQAFKALSLEEQANIKKQHSLNLMETTVQLLKELKDEESKGPSAEQLAVAETCRGFLRQMCQ